MPDSRGFFALLFIVFVALLAVSMAASGGVTISSHRQIDDVASYGCGVERWSVKTGTDLDASKINLTSSVWTSPGRLARLPTPPSLPSTSRIAPTEETVYRMTVTLLSFKEEADSDIHLRVQGTSGVQMIAEIPAPSCVQPNSPLDARIIAARSDFQSTFGVALGSWKTVNRPVHLTGVGFFDFQHGQSGAPPNAVELHPVLSIHPAL